MFTVHPPIRQHRNDLIRIKALETFPNFASGLSKWTLPIRKCVDLLSLCERIGISAATVYPGTEGVGKATHEYLLRDLVRQMMGEEYLKQVSDEEGERIKK